MVRNTGMKKFLHPRVNLVLLFVKYQYYVLSY